MSFQFTHLSPEVFQAVISSFFHACHVFSPFYVFLSALPEFSLALCRGPYPLVVSLPISSLSSCSPPLFDLLSLKFEDEEVIAQEIQKGNHNLCYDWGPHPLDEEGHIFIDIEAGKKWETVCKENGCLIVLPQEIAIS